MISPHDAASPVGSCVAGTGRPLPPRKSARATFTCNLSSYNPPRRRT